MAMAILVEIIRNPTAYAPDMIVYVPDRAPDVSLLTEVLLVQHGAYCDDDVRGYRYLLEAGAIAEVLEGLSNLLGTAPTAEQGLRAILHYAEHDAFPELEVVMG